MALLNLDPTLCQHQFAQDQALTLAFPQGPLFPAARARVQLVDYFQDEQAYQLGKSHGVLHKLAGKASLSYAMAGRLYLSDSGWLLLSVPNGLVHGVFDTIHEPGVELPLKDGKLTAHISVLRPEDIEQLGGADKVSERGHSFRYTLGPLREVAPAGWSEMSRVWFVEVHSPELEALRRSYGLSSRPKNNQFHFHITVAAKRKHVLKENDLSKAGAINTPDPGLPYRERTELYPLRRGSILTGLLQQGAPATFGGGVEPGEDPVQAAARELTEETGYQVRNVRPAGLAQILRDWPALEESQLDQKARERRRQFRGDRTHFFVGDVHGPRLTASEPSSFRDIRFRRPQTLLRMLEAVQDKSPFDQRHVEFLSRLGKKAAAGTKQHDKPTQWAKDRDGDYEVCPHCAKRLEEKDVYTDNKGWEHHRPCLHRGSIKRTKPYKSAVHMLGIHITHIQVCLPKKMTQLLRAQDSGARKESKPGKQVDKRNDVSPEHDDAPSQ